MQTSYQTSTVQAEEAMDWPIKNLWRLYLNLAELEQGLLLLNQAKRRERGGWRHPSLAGPTLQLEKDLLASYDQLFKDLIGSLKGSSDDISSGRLLLKKNVRVTKADLASAQEEFNLSGAESQQPLDRTRLAGLLTILALWRQRHEQVDTVAVQAAYSQGRQKALAEAKVPEHHPVDTTSDLSGAALARFSDDLDRLEAGLRDGTARSYGLNWIIEHAATLGEAAIYLSRLKGNEQYRVGMYAEALLWVAWQNGYREGAVEATRAKLAQLGYDNVEAVPDEQRNELPRYIWVGPQDEKACQPCLGMFDEPVYAESLADLPEPSTVCDFGINCRHDWELANG
jgi:hypothetical protein